MHRHIMSVLAAFRAGSKRIVALDQDAATDAGGEEEEEAVVDETGESDDGEGDGKAAGVQEGGGSEGSDEDGEDEEDAEGADQAGGPAQAGRQGRRRVAEEEEQVWIAGRSTMLVVLHAHRAAG
jgi:hypothetical protein